MRTLVAERLFDGEQIRSDIPVVIGDDGHICAIGGAVTEGAERLSGLLAPGLVDVQVNGGGGALFNNDPSVEALWKMSQAHARFGTTAFLPTLITDKVEVMQRAADAVSAALREGIPGVIGVHFEGPHLSVPKKGTHEERFIRPLSDAELAIYARDDLGIKVVTLAPENVSQEDIRRLVALGVRVCLGHSNADGATAAAALRAGATGFTHLYNAMSPLQSREAGMVGTALISDGAWCGMIADGHHLCVEAMTLALKAKPRGKLMLVTDAMSLVGSDETSFPLFERIVTKRGDKLTSTTGELAGSHLDMISAVRNIRDWCGLELEEALRMGSLYPAQFLGSSAGRIAVGGAADLILLDDNLRVQKTWIGGREVFSQLA
ncbi:N-acetylglucosamine-6-phosphate deacetylase [Microbulbifer thermotolerans]|uniref:N-acetylglucosamine-6-phosphate deacetylase n=1 Tax=Microbulbifer thermotolerans TaxID=252514 RepID=A0AB35HVF0_MICTH|nr:N-acetylglucosamine-6-phosphate deacetylase [Microbulbifer thermotolerans]MCX2780546.1 N-acetylglucosamine-6-phosphate deacetylase [Microbulbifer thermotolerans]MCX2783157.1 N-acetylglucosamine-6-phosphate deacetylase [Microbulbifer thermotolerans]MCX2800737.1 N-acetylglucosamine-6-phosphate deacetylase [Microbulbifer thermotolerans]MCX2803524.1 N-acetylglucosamine-6-phosphate deacetylase [Microbulbifer thermotolerans]MCX2841471.1 N-acetylglucosamine-6-phosphate deacetylase [Microbulbifer t